MQNDRGPLVIGLSSQKDCLGYRVIVKSVERVADHAVKIAENVLSLSEKVDPAVFQKISEMSLFARSVFNDSIESLFKKDYMLADNMVAKAKTIASMQNKTINAIAKKLELTEMSNIRMITESIRRTAEYASDIAEIVLNLNVNQITTD
ncbi:MAG: PhoU domain-containing protein [Candidatus Bathyarchaeia archaeon]